MVAIVGISLMLLSDECGRLARDETPYSLWEKFITYIYLFCFPSLFSFFWTLLMEAHLLLKSKVWHKEV